MEGMGNEDARAPRQTALHNILEDSLANVCIQSREWIIEDNDIAVTVDRAAYINTLSLAARQGDTPFSNLSGITMGQHLQRIMNELVLTIVQSGTHLEVWLKRRCLDCGPILGFFKWSPETDVFTDGRVLDR